MYPHTQLHTFFDPAADIESLLSSPLSSGSALPLVLELCIKEEEEDVLLLALEIIGLLIENGLFITVEYLYIFSRLIQ